MSITTIDIVRKRGDTKRIIFQIKDDTGTVVDITSWTGFLLTVDPAPNPTDNTTKVFEITGVIVDGPNGRVAFSPDGLADIGVYFYDVQGLDNNSEKITFVEGSYTLNQDITKG